MPEGSIYTIQVVFSHDESLDSHLTRLEKGIVGTSLKPQEVRDDIKTARNELSTGNRLFWVNQAVFYQAEDEQQAQAIEKNLHTIFNDAKMPLIHSSYDIHPLNSCSMPCHLTSIPTMPVSTYALTA